MKKLFVLFAAATLLVGMQACKSKTDETVSEETIEVTTDSTTVVEPMVTTDSSTTTTTTVVDSTVKH